jgi:hypothetical protein
MANSFSHKLGQIIGDTLEIAIEPFLREFATENHLYLDKKEYRNARKGTKLTWIDINENKHDLDFVLEDGGTEDKIGKPVAFIECAWRRYTKYSRNKSQEIQGAIIPLFEKYRTLNPFIGVVLAGEFTKNSLKQLESLGFKILFFSYEKIIDAFSKIEIDVNFNEETSEKHFEEQIEKYENLSPGNKELLYKSIIEKNLLEINNFISSLKNKVYRKISKICIWTIYGKQFTFSSVERAREFIINIELENIEPIFDRYEAELEYNNGDLIKLSFHEQNELLIFLSGLV